MAHLVIGTPLETRTQNTASADICTVLNGFNGISAGRPCGTASGGLQAICNWPNSCIELVSCWTAIKRGRGGQRWPCWESRGGDSAVMVRVCWHKCGCWKFANAPPEGCALGRISIWASKVHSQPPLLQVAEWGIKSTIWRVTVFHSYSGLRQSEFLASL